jgi:hypothetical protein
VVACLLGRTCLARILKFEAGEKENNGRKVNSVTAGLSLTDKSFFLKKMRLHDHQTNKA